MYAYFDEISHVNIFSVCDKERCAHTTRMKTPL